MLVRCRKDEFLGLFEGTIDKEKHKEISKRLPDKAPSTSSIVPIVWSNRQPNNKSSLGKFFGEAKGDPRKDQVFDIYVVALKDKFSIFFNKSKNAYKSGVPYSSPEDLGKKIQKIIMAYMGKTESRNYSTEDEERTNVIVKVGNKWRIKGKKQKYWDAEYDTKEKAQAALRAYWANKKECYNQTTTEGFTNSLGKDFIKKVQSFLIKIFGPTLYFDHITNNSADLYYRGDEVAELLYNDKTEEVVISPEDDNLSPVKFYDTSIYEINNYLSDLLLGDIEPQFV